MNAKLVLGIAIAAGGVVLLAIGLNAADAPADQIAKTFTGHYTDWTMRYLLGGTAAIVGGAVLAVFGRRSS